MIFDHNVALAAILLFGVATSLIMTRLSSRLTLALVGTIIALSAWGLLNITPIETWVNSFIPALSSLVKSMVLIAVLLLGNLFIDEMGRNYLRPVRWTLPAVMTVLKGYAWADARSTCNLSSQEDGFAFIHCAYRIPLYVLSEFIVYAAVALMVVAIMTVLWPMASWRSRVGHTMGLFVAVSAACLGWLSIATAGVRHISQGGELSEWQYEVRSILASAVVILNVIAVLYLPMRAALDAAFFRRRARTLISALDTVTPGPDLPTSNPTTRVMDHLGIALDQSGVAVQNGSSPSGAAETAAWLRGSATPPRTIPLGESSWVQRAWLLQVARMMKR